MLCSRMRKKRIAEVMEEDKDSPLELIEILGFCTTCQHEFFWNVNEELRCPNCKIVLKRQELK